MVMDTHTHTHTLSRTSDPFGFQQHPAAAQRTQHLPLRKKQKQVFLNSRCSATPGSGDKQFVTNESHTPSEGCMSASCPVTVQGPAGSGPVRVQGSGPVREQGSGPVRVQGSDPVRVQGSGSADSPPSMVSGSCSVLRLFKFSEFSDSCLAS